MSPTLFACLIALVVSVPPLDTWVDAHMARIMTVQYPLQVAMGLVAGGALHDRARRADPHGLGGLFFLVGALLFWMLPRSLDRVAADWRVDALQAACLFGGGVLLGARWRVLPFAARGAASIMLLSMLLAVGLFYRSAQMLLCSRFTLEMQGEAGRAMHLLALALAPLALGSLARILWRAVRPAPTDADAARDSTGAGAAG